MDRTIGLASWWSRWHQAVALVVLTLAVFAPTLSAEFVYDSRLQILTDPFLHDPRNWWPVLSWNTLRMDVLDFNRPVNLASLMIDAACWGKRPFGYHLSSVLLHAANVVCTWALIRRLADDRSDGAPAAAAATGDGSAMPLLSAPLLGALLFAFHPVVVEAVCEPSYREDLLVALFTLAALLAAAWHVPPNRDLRRVGACTACALGAIGSKESGIAVPVALAALWWVRGHGDRGRFWGAATAATTIAVVGFLIARFVLEPTPSAIFESRPQYPGGSFRTALALEPRILALYGQLIVWPANLSADYGVHSLRHLPLPVALVVVALVVAAALMALRHDRRMAVAAALVAAPLLSVANLVPIYRPAADRYLYLPMAGIGLAVGLAMAGPWSVRRAGARRAIVACATAVVLVLAAGCVARQGVWRDSLALWSDTVRKNPLSHTATVGLAEALHEARRLPEAEAAARRAIGLSHATDGDTWALLAVILADQGRASDAFVALDRALEIKPALADPDARVAVMAMDRVFAEALKELLARRRSAP